MNDRRLRLGAFLPTFFRSEAVQNTVRRLLQQTRPPDLLLVVDNASDARTERMVSELADRRVVYHRMEKNLGSAGGAAYGVQWLYEQGVDLIYCGDDDDPPKTNDTIERTVRLLEMEDQSVAAAGAVGARWDWGKGRLIRVPNNELTGVLEVDLIGGSGQMILRRDGIARFGLPNAQLFFGYPDLEYCLRIRKAGYRLLVDGELMKEFRVQAGRWNWSSRRKLLPRRPRNRIWRDYYTCRNYIFMMNRTFERPDLARRAVWKAIARSMVAWGRGIGYGYSFTCLQIRAIFDGYAGRLGIRIVPKANRGKSSFHARAPESSDRGETS